ncbi:MAG: hypothetical protein HYZ53_12175 [Planctomycetes bacterium]|nr:hypothetical protein [Planctomycetota bacterium]
MFNLYDLTGGNYHVHRVLTYPECPNSKLEFDAEVRAVNAGEWSTLLNVTGTYDGPTDIVSAKDYQLTWTTDGKTLIEKGSATLGRSSGGSIRSEWSSTFTSPGRSFRLPRSGESVRVSVAPFKIAGNSMSYEWEGTVRAGE